MVPVNFQLVRLAQQPRKLGLATSRIRRIVSSTTYLFSKRSTRAVCSGTRESCASTTKGKNDNKQKEQWLSNPFPTGGRGRVVLPYLYGWVPLDRVWCMMVCGHSALIGIYCQDFKPPAAPLYPTWDKYPSQREGGGALYLLGEYFAVFGRTWLSDCKIRLTR